MTKELYRKARQIAGKYRILNYPFEDRVQECMLAGLKAIEKYNIDPESCEEKVIFYCMRNRLLSIARHEQKFQMLSLPEDHLLGVHLQEDFLQTIVDIQTDDEAKEFVREFISSGCSFEEMGKRLEKKPGTLRVQWHRKFKEKVKKACKDHGITSTGFKKPLICVLERREKDA